MASANGHDEVIRTLLEEGADVSLKNAEGNTPLHWACLNGQLEAVKLLIDAGASPSALNEADETPVDAALSRNHRPVVDYINALNRKDDGEDNKQADAEGGAEEEEGEEEEEEEVVVLEQDEQ